MSSDLVRKEGCKHSQSVETDAGWVCVECKQPTQAGQREQDYRVLNQLNDYLQAAGRIFRGNAEMPIGSTLRIKRPQRYKNLTEEARDGDSSKD